MPVALAPIGLGGMWARRGEVQAARAAHQAGLPFCLSTVSICPIAEVKAGSPAEIWFQLYMIRDREFMRTLLAEAASAGITKLLFTVDLPMPGARYRDYRSGLAGPSFPGGGLRRALQIASRPDWAIDVGLNGRPHTMGNILGALGGKGTIGDFLGWIGKNFDASVTWKDIEWVRQNWQGQLIIKGILDPEDAQFAADAGADGIVVSNHGGRQLDGVISSVRALPPIVEKVGDKLTVLADGGIRSGLDVVRMLALGAKFVLIGRAWAFALAGGKEHGVGHMLGTMRAEMSIAMALTGCRNVAEITRDVVQG
jgi:L-lactate dehydrogenase (cytochrome)